MNKDELYQILDIVAPEEFEYYENLAALLEADEIIDAQLILELIKKLDIESLVDMFDSYFEEWNKSIPDDLAELYVTVDTAKRSIMGHFNEDMTDEDYSSLANAIYDFRRWYVTTPHVVDNDTGEELNVRDARYNLSASRYTGEICNYNFNEAYKYEGDSYSMRLSDIIEAEYN
ncbi:hypothetical protein QU661_04435 [Mogibacterium neglectum]|uniref:hypothetical protein n=1 Tax=Mogibacterium neglectum TaxID=114528 RepID=UPI002729657A|nr:hypothetical protein [Mogibacterium neglectum]WLD75549.1 hypothetical protein QU661_04435 [Mogibacterium neglectum]